MGVRFEVFGGVRAFSAAGAVPLRPQVARVLGILLAEPATPVSVERIVDRLWRADPPITATKVVHVSVGRLRRALEDHGAGASLLRTTTAGYVLEAGAHDLDEYQSARARVEALRHRRPDEALIAANDAHHAWRGRPWGEDADAEWIADRVRALEEDHRTLVETWADLLLE
jgi:DNA-binding SARP family transcriptional activator